LAIFSFIAVTIYANALIALPCAVMTLISSQYVLDGFSFPFDPYREVAFALDRKRPGFTEDFAQFAYDRKLLAPDTILDAYKLFQRYTARR
jgi:hypothetical protein